MGHRELLRRKALWEIYTYSSKKVQVGKVGKAFLSTLSTLLTLSRDSSILSC